MRRYAGADRPAIATGRRWLWSHRTAVWVFLLALLPGLATTYTAHRTAQRQSAAEFDRVAELAVDRVVSRMRQHVVALRASRGLWDALDGTVSRDQFTRFLASVDLVKELSGARAIGFAPMVSAQEPDPVGDWIAATYGVRVAPPQPTDQPWRTPVLMVEPSTDGSLHALGYDMYSDPTRRAAMNAAVAADSAMMSGPVELVGADTPANSVGFLIYLPTSGPKSSRGQDAAPAAGFVYAAFRGQDLIEAALTVGPPLAVTMDVLDATDRPQVIYTGPNTKAGPERRIRMQILGREWEFAVHPQADTGPVDYLDRTILLGLISVLFALSMGYAVAARQDEAARARELAAAATRESEYRNLLVHEMKHRIKNHISRIQSIARQSARSAVDVKSFTETFEARLRAMASVQEILAGTAVAQADVRAILRKELQQCLDKEEVEHLLDGPSIQLDERQSHAFAMVVHELVTNAMKYGGLSINGRGLKVTWQDEPGGPGNPRHLVVTWREHFDEPAPPSQPGSGFGSRLIDASLKGELSGTLDRDFLPDGLLVRLSFPVTPIPATPGRARS